MSIPDISGYWTGEIRGTNRGGVTLDIKQEGEKLSGIAKMHEPALGGYEYIITGVIKEDGISLRLLPGRHTGGLQLGIVQAVCRLEEDGSISGRWKSDIGTEGIFTAQKHETKKLASELSKKNSVMNSKPIEIFLSYSHADEELMNQVREQLMIYDRQRQICKWWDRKLLAGTSIEGEIAKRLAYSDIILLFISSSFIASDFCYDIEMQQALRQHEEGRSVVVPVILRVCEWQSAPFGELLALPTDGRPLTTWPNRDEAAKNVADGVMRIVADLQKKSAGQSPP